MMRIGIIGTGFGSKIHVPGFRRLEDVEVVGIAGHDAKKTEEIAQKLGIARAFSTWQELVADPEIDAVSIATPPYLHAEIARVAIAKGKHILCEKPLAMDVAEAEELARLAKEANVTNMVDFEFRVVPHFEVLKEELNAKTIGTINQVHITWLTGGRARPGVKFGWQNETRFGGGALMNIGSHVIDYVEWLFGSIASVTAQLDIRKPMTEGDRVADADDTCSMFLKLADGTPVTVSFSNVAIAGRGHLIDVYGQTGSYRLENTNLKDTINGFRLYKIGFDEIAEEISAPEFPAYQETSTDGRLDAFTEIAKRFVGGIRTKTSPSPSFEDGVRVQRVIEKVMK